MLITNFKSVPNESKMMFNNCIRSIALISIVMMTLSCIEVSARFVPFDDPVINIETVTGVEDLNETYLRVAIADPENPSIESISILPQITGYWTLGWEKL